MTTYNNLGNYDGINTIGDVSVFISRVTTKLTTFASKVINRASLVVLKLPLIVLLVIAEFIGISLVSIVVVFMRYYLGYLLKRTTTEIKNEDDYLFVRELYTQLEVDIKSIDLFCKKLNTHGGLVIKYIFVSEMNKVKNLLQTKKNRISTNLSIYNNIKLDSDYFTVSSEKELWKSRATAYEYIM